MPRTIVRRRGPLGPPSPPTAWRYGSTREIWAEGYFRREWRLAVERTLDMADDHLFLLPIVIDDTDEAVARVPEKFLSVQWLKVPGGRPTPALEGLCRRISAPTGAEPERKRTASARPSSLRAAAPAYPPFPREELGQRVRFWAPVIGWVGQSIWITFQRLPRWARQAGCDCRRADGKFPGHVIILRPLRTIAGRGQCDAGSASNPLAAP